MQVDAPDRATTYTLDPVGNRIAESVSALGTPVSQSALTYDVRDSLTSRDDPIAHVHVTLAYDADGNQTEEAVDGAIRTFHYDPRDRLTTLAQPNAPPLTFDYDREGQRLRKTQGTSETRYQYDGASLLAETNAIGNPLSRYHYSATQLLSRTEAGSTPTYRHYLLDALKTPIALLTQEGAISARTSYDAWGEIRRQQGTNSAVIQPSLDSAIANLTTTDAQPIGFTGYVKDDESGLYYAKARYYDPAVARFTSEDPEAGNSMQPPSLHRYLYAYANPTVYTDPSGRCADLLCAWGMGFAYAQNDEDRASITRAALNTDPALGRTAGALYEGSQLVTGPAQMMADVSSAADGDAGAQARWGQRLDALNAFGNRMEEARQKYGDAGSVAQLFVDFAQGVGEHAAQVKVAGEKQDWFSQGQAGARVAGDVATVASGMGAARSFVGRAVVTEGTAAAVVVEDSAGAAAARLERRMAINPDNDFGPSNRLTYEERVASAGDRVVTFGGSNMPRYYDRTDATLGAPGGSVWVMPLDDAARIGNRADVVTQTGHAPGVTRAYLEGQPMYGVSVPSEGLGLRAPTAADVGVNSHWREGGYTGVQHEGQWYQNPTREFVTDGGRSVPEDSVFFKVNPDSSWTPVRRY